MRARGLSLRLLGALALAGLVGCSLFAYPFDKYDADLPGTAERAANDASADGAAASPTPPSCADADLTSDSKNCGACGHDCRGAACVERLCQPTMVFQDPVRQVQATSVAVDDAYVYAAAQSTDGANGRMLRFSKKSAGTAANGETLATGIYGSDSIIVLGAELFWTQGSWTNGAANANGIGRVSKAPGDSAQLIIMATAPETLVSDGRAIYWNDGKSAWTANQTSPYSAHSVFTIPGTSQAEINGIAIDATGLYVSIGGTAGGVTHLDKDNFAPSIVATQLDPQNLAVDDGYVYWTAVGADRDAGVVGRAPKDGGGTATMLATSQHTPIWIAVDGDAVYWTVDPFADHTGGAILKAPKSGGAPLIVARLFGSYHDAGYGFALDATDIYWADNGNVYRVAK